MSLVRGPIGRNRDKLITDSDELFGKKHSIFYLESALKKAYKRQKKEKEEVFDHVDNLAEDDICDDVRVINALNLLPVKKVHFQIEDQTNILKIYEVVKSVVEERSFKNPAVIAADITEELLRNSNFYFTISSRTILRWYHQEEKSMLILKRKFGVT